MGLIKAAMQAGSSMLADQWLEVVEPEDMGARTVMTRGKFSENAANKKGGRNIISNGSVIHVYEGQFMMLLDGGKIIDFCGEPGYFTVDNSTSPSLFSGGLGDALKQSFQRFKFDGASPVSQKVVYINLQEINGIRFGTRNPINYFDDFYNAELFLRAHGTYSIKITDPVRFYGEVLPKNEDHVEIDDINQQFLDEFMDALQSSINQMSQEGIRISHVTSKSRELSKYMADTLDEEWKTNRGMEIQSVGIASVSYDEESQKLINMRNQGAMLSDPTVREGYVQGAFARGMEAAGNNPNGAATGFMGFQMAGQTGGMASAMSSANMQQMQMQQQQQQMQQQQMQQQQQQQQSADGWTCSCGAHNTGKFCAQCGQPKPQKKTWICSCGHENTGKFCSECGKPMPVSDTWTCSCGHENTGKFCNECGKPRP